MPKLQPPGRAYNITEWLHRNARLGFPKLVLSRDDFLTLEHIAVLHEVDGVQLQVSEIWKQLEVWNDERVLRPERLRAARSAFRTRIRRRGARVSVLRPEKPAWQRRGGHETKRFRWRETRPLPGYVPPADWKALMTP